MLKFTLTELVLLPLTFAMLAGVAVNVPIFYCRFEGWFITAGQVRHIHSTFSNRTSLMWSGDAQSVNAWLAESTVDSWGRPYVSVERADQTGELQLHFYSNGRDGISKSNGDDPDDLNSWDQGFGAFYDGEIRNGIRARRVTMALIVSLLLYPLFVICKRRYFKRRHSSRG